MHRPHGVPRPEPVVADHASGQGPSPPALAGLARLLELFLAWSVAVLAAWWLILAIQHVDDRALIGWAEGAKMALAHDAARGTLYPPLFEDGRFGGTRFMPIPILVHAGLSRLTGELLISGKLATYLSFAVLIALGYRAMRDAGCSRRRAAILLAAVVATGVGIVTSLRISHDPFPVAFQLGALLLVTRRPAKRTILFAGMLCSAAMFAKLSAVWGFAAIGLWLWRRNRSALWAFLASFVTMSVVGAAATQLASGGTFAETVTGLSLSGLRDGGAEHALREFLSAFVSAPALFVLLPAAAVETMIAFHRAEVTVFHLGFLFAASILVLVLTDLGATFNHALDLLILSAILTARLSARWEDLPERTAALAIVMTVSLLVSFPTALGVVGDALSPLESGDPSRPLGRLVGPDHRVLSEDASIPLALGQEPVILDPFMLLRIVDRHPEWVDLLVERIESHGFDRIVLVYPPDEAPDGWYTRKHLGAEVIGAVERNYTLIGEQGRLFVYAPG